MTEKQVVSIAGLVPAGRVVVGVKAADKVAVLAALARLAGERMGVKPEVLLGRLAAREGLGSTGVGSGVAMPHARVEGISAPEGWFVRLAKPVEFSAIDGGKVDLLFLLLSPVSDDGLHLAALAAMSRRLRAPGVAKALRAAGTAEAVRSLLVEG